MRGRPKLPASEIHVHTGYEITATGWGPATPARVVPLYYGARERWIDMMAHAIALNGPFFRTHRMVRPYVLKAYFH